MAGGSGKFTSPLEPIDRISEILFGLIMVLTITTSVCLVFFSTFPVVIPFLLVEDARLGLRMSNLVAIVMLFLCGYAFARCTGLNPWLTGLVMVVVGSLMVPLRSLWGG